MRGDGFVARLEAGTKHLLVAKPLEVFARALLAHHGVAYGAGPAWVDLLGLARWESNRHVGGARIA